MPPPLALLAPSLLRASAATSADDGSRSAMDPSTVSPPPPSGPQVLQTSISVYFPMLVAAWIFFEVLRRRSAPIFERVSHFFALPQHLYIGGWVPMLFTITDREIVERCGLDAWVFLRFVRLSQKIAGLAVICSFGLFPLYASGASRDLPIDNDDDSVPAPQRAMDSFDRFSIANVDEVGRWRLWFAVATAYVVSLAIMALVNKEYEAYMHTRHSVLGGLDAQQYSVVVTDLPRRLRRPQPLLAYMNYLFPNAVHSVYVGVECGVLEKLLETRHKLQVRLDSAVAQLHVAGDATTVSRPTITINRSFCLLCCGGTRVDAIEYYGQEIEKTDRALQAERAAIKARQSEELSSTTTTTGTSTPRGQYGAVAGSELRDISGANELDDEQDEHGTLSKAPSTRKGLFGWFARKPPSVRKTPSARSGETDRLLGGTTTAADLAASDHPGRPLSKKLPDVAMAMVESIVGKPIGTETAIMRSAAFVGFRSLRAAQAAQQLLQTENPMKLRITAAPNLLDMVWENFGLPHKLVSSWRLISACLTFVIVLFWTIPTAFVTSLANVQKLRVTYPFVDKLVLGHPWVQKTLEQLAPLLLSAMNTLASVIFKLLATREGHLSNAEVQASTFYKLCYFQVFQMFFVSAVTGSIIAQLVAIVDQPKRVFFFLGSSIASQSMLFVTFIIVQTCVSLPLLWLRVVPVIKDTLHRWFAPQYAQVPERQPWLGLVPLNFEPDIDPSLALAQQFLVLLLVLVFAPIAPLVAYVGLLFFLCAEVVYRRHFFFVVDAKWARINSTGAFWPPLFSFLLVALYIAQATLIGLLSLKLATYGQLFAAVLLPFMTFGFHWYVTTMRGYPSAAQFLPLDRCCDLDADRKDSSFDFLDGVYQQPAMTKSVALPNATAAATAVAPETKNTAATKTAAAPETKPTTKTAKKV